MKLHNADKSVAVAVEVFEHGVELIQSLVPFACRRSPTKSEKSRSTDARLREDLTVSKKREGCQRASSSLPALALDFLRFKFFQAPREILFLGTNSSFFLRELCM